MLLGALTLFVCVKDVDSHFPTPAEVLPSNDVLAGYRHGITLRVVKFELEGADLPSHVSRRCDFHLRGCETKRETRLGHQAGPNFANRLGSSGHWGAEGENRAVGGIGSYERVKVLGLPRVRPGYVDLADRRFVGGTISWRDPRTSQGRGETSCEVRSENNVPEWVHFPSYAMD